MNAGFADHFSDQSHDYARFRPSYPPDLFAWLAEVAPERRLAWDCATGSGQATLGLSEHFDQVVASDASDAQLAGATPHPRVRYLRARAEAPGLAGGRFDLITVAQALHWFDLDAFYQEVRRLLRPDGVLAVWSYQLLRCEPGVDALLDRFDRDIVGPYWPPERRLVDNGYRDLPFPFAELPAPGFDMRADWDLYQLRGYLGTWSSVQRYRKALGRDPLQRLGPEFAAAWGDASAERRIRWPLALRVGRNH
jgi:SAM-dependent methyltransferase